MDKDIKREMLNAMDTNGFNPCSIDNDSIASCQHQGDFEIGNFTEYLTRAKERGKYICPLCSEPDLSINTDGKKYQCYSCYQTGDIAKFLLEQAGNGSPRQTSKKDSKEMNKRELTLKDGTEKVIPIEQAKGWEQVTKSDSKPSSEPNETGQDGKATDKPLVSEKAGSGAAIRFKRQSQVTQWVKDNLTDLKYDVRKDQILLNGEHLSMDGISSYMCEEHGIDADSGKWTEAFIHLSRSNPYDAVLEYLEQAGKAEPIDPETAFQNLFMAEYDTDGNVIVDANGESLDAKILEIYETQNNHLELCIEYLKILLLGLVHRAYDPGCQYDYVPTLYGKQGLKKTTFFKTLVGIKFFDGSITLAKDADNLAKLSEAWCGELGELERITGKREAGEVKDFITQTHANIRKAYRRDNQKVPRRSVIVGSVNKTNFLQDETGNRRFIVIPVYQEINLDWLEKNRDGIFSWAIQEYKKGTKPYLSKKWEQAQREDNDTYQNYHPWIDKLEPWLEVQAAMGGRFTTTNEILDHLKTIDIPIAYSNWDKQQVAQVMTQLGWELKRVRISINIDGGIKQVSRWYPPKEDG